MSKIEDQSDYSFGVEVEMLRSEVELAGFTPDTPEFERAFLARRVSRCQELRGVSHCTNCRAFDICPYGKAHLIELKYGAFERNNERMRNNK